MNKFFIELEPAMVDIVLAGLGKLPLEVSGNVYAQIRATCDQQKIEMQKENINGKQSKQSH